MVRSLVGRPDEADCFMRTEGEGAEGKGVGGGGSPGISMCASQSRSRGRNPSLAASGVSTDVLC